MSDDTPAAAAKEALLDRYPVNEIELDTLLKLFAIYEASRSLFGGGGRDDAFDYYLPERDAIFQRALKTVFVIGGGDDNEQIKNIDRFLEACVSLCGRRGERFLLEALFAAAAADGQEEGTADPTKLASLIYRLCQACCTRIQDAETPSSEQPELPKSWIDTFSTVTTKEDQPASLAEWKEWANRMIPNVHQLLSSVFCCILFGSKAGFISFLPEPCSSAHSTSSSTTQFWQKSNDAIPIQLALMDLGGPWRRIFSSDQDGLSFLTFQEKLTSFYGPTLTLIQTTKRDTLGYFSEVPWKTSLRWFTGQGESFLFRLSPHWSVYKLSGAAALSTDKCHQFLNLPVPHRRDSLVGLAVGGIAPDLPRLHINMELENCKACPFGSVFDTGALLGSDDDSFFDVDLLEVWAVRVNSDSFREGVQAGELRASVKETARQHLAQVNREAFVEDFASGAYVNNLFSHRVQCRGRADFVASDDEGGGYFVESKPPSNN